MSVVPSSPIGRLAVYAAILAAVLGVGAAAGAAFGPAGPAGPTDAGSHMAAHETTDGSAPADMPKGLAVSQDGYELRLATTEVAAGRPAELRFVVAGPDGHPLTGFEVAHEKELHLVVVSRDLRTYAHLHPTRDAAGTWSVTGPALPAGSYRVYADFVPAGGSNLTLAADLAVPGDYAPRPVGPAVTAVDVDGYHVAVAGDLVAGAESELAVTVTRDGAPVRDLQPYLGALGHLVAIRDGDLAYLHVHPLSDADGPGGPTVRFAVEVPTAGTYGLYFDFEHGGAVHSARLVAAATPAGEHG